MVLKWILGKEVLRMSDELSTGLMSSGGSW